VVKANYPVCTLMQFKKDRTHRLTDRQTDRQTDTQTHRAYKWLQVSPSKLTLIQDKIKYDG